jgi:tRNA modification GTPase
MTRPSRAPNQSSRLPSPPDPGASLATIYAPATAAGRAGIAVLRLSGPAAGEAARSLAGVIPAPRRAHLADLKDPASGELLDRGLMLWFPAPASFTGEDVLELHLHGGRAVMSGMLAALAKIPCCRPAEPGEFTRRAFDHGKLDLTAVEGLADLVAAETAAQRRQALRQLGGTLSTLYEGWRARLLRALAHLEADIDFADQPLPQELATIAAQALAALAQEMRAHLADEGRGERLRLGLHIAILGAPNVGKSSVLNALARREAAIVSARAGTTRDVIELDLDLGGYPVTIADTAGLREAADEIEEEGIKRARQRAERTDLKLVVLDATALPHIPDAVAALIDAHTILVANKIDLAPASVTRIGAHDLWLLSAHTGAGLAALEQELARRAAALLDTGADPHLTRARHRAALEECLAALERARRAAAPELEAEDVRLAMRALGRITGRVDVEDLLDLIFREFCIGK